MVDDGNSSGERAVVKMRLVCVMRKDTLSFRYLDCSLALARSWRGSCTSAAATHSRSSPPKPAGVILTLRSFDTHTTAIAGRPHDPARFLRRGNTF